MGFSLELKSCLVFHWPVIIASFRYMFERPLYIITVNSKEVRDQGTGTYGLKLFIPMTGPFGQLSPILVSSPRAPGSCRVTLLVLGGHKHRER